MQNEIITIENIDTLVGKTIQWSAPSAPENSPYGGIAIIKAIDKTARKPFTNVEILSGDSIEYAFVEAPYKELNFSDEFRYLAFTVITAETKHILYDRVSKKYFSRHGAWVEDAAYACEFTDIQIAIDTMGTIGNPNVILKTI